MKLGGNNLVNRSQYQNILLQTVLCPRDGGRIGTVLRCWPVSFCGLLDRLGSSSELWQFLALSLGLQPSRGAYQIDPPILRGLVLVLFLSLVNRVNEALGTLLDQTFGLLNLLVGDNFGLA